MKTRKIAVVIIVVVVVILTACVSCEKCGKETSTKASGTSVTAEATPMPTPTPIPTYAPGTELYGMLSVTGEVVVEPKYEQLYLFTEDGLARFCAHGLWGFVNKKGEEVIPPQYEEANNFSKGLAAVKIDGLYGFIDTTGKMVLEPQFEGVDNGFHFDRCIIDERGHKGLIDTKGNVIVEPIYTSIVLTSNNYFIVSNTNEYGIIDREGAIVVDFQEQEIYMVTDKGNYFMSREYDPLDPQAVKADIYDLSGNHYVARTDYSWAFSRPLRNVMYVTVSPNGEHWGLLALEEGQFIVDPIYDFISYSDGDEFAYVELNEKSGALNFKTGGIVLGGVSNVEYGYVLIEKDGRYGVYDLDGKEIISTQYDMIYLSPTGIFSATKNEGCYLIDLQGSILFEADDLTISTYNPSIDCWEFTYKENIVQGYNYFYIDGFISSDGTKVDMKCWSDHGGVVPDAFYEDFADNPEIIAQIGQSEALINPMGDPKIIVFSEYYDFPKQNVVVVTDKEGNYGLITYQGEVLFQLQDCIILTNTDLSETDEISDYKYETYNDTDYLIYIVEME